MRILLLLLIGLSSAAHAASVSVTSIAMPEYLEKPNLQVELAAVQSSMANDTKGQVALIRLADSKDLLKTIYSSSFVRFAQLQQQIPQGLLVTKGRVTLQQLASQYPTVIVKQSENDYLARLPIIIDIDAGLTLSDKQRLLLSTDRGSFVHNNGELIVDGGAIIGWDSRTGNASRFSGDSSEFRAFIIAFGGSSSHFNRATIASLGFDASSSYGFTARTATVATLNMLSSAERKIVEKPPRVAIQSSEFSDMYVGVYMDGASDSYIIDSAVKDSIDTGVQVANQSRNINIVRNTVSGTRLKHGIVVSTGVEQSTVMHNTVTTSTRSGILLDRLTSSATVAFNDVNGNRKDGISVYESQAPILYGNRVYKNGSHGIRVRSSQNAMLQHNIILGNQGSAVYLHRNDSSEDSQSTAQVLGGLMVENASGAIYASGQQELIIGALKTEGNGAQEFRGDLTAKAGDIIVATWKEGTAALVTEVSDK